MSTENHLLCTCRSLGSASWTPRQNEQVQSLLMALLKQQIDKKTQGDSTSIRIEEAEELMQSIAFSLGLYMKENNLSKDILLQGDLPKLLCCAQQMLEEQFLQAREHYQLALQTIDTFGNHILAATLKGIAPFFASYDFRLYAHHINADIDYQLCHPISESLQGVQYVDAYLSHLMMENELLTCFPRNRVLDLLARNTPDYSDLPLNMFEPVCACAIGLALAGDGVSLLAISQQQAMQVSATLSAPPKNVALKALESAAFSVCAHLRLHSPATQQYIERAAAKMYPRLVASTHSACGVFSVFTNHS